MLFPFIWLFEWYSLKKEHLHQNSIFYSRKQKANEKISSERELFASFLKSLMQLQKDMQIKAS